ncbi:DUF1427 family protein [Gallaecimonas mangrovi]|uniref:DUF1427 family protein n=1 Tax=Gallaecimonas mangrovi TaxID=2291597 RepID=UPI000E201523|nr:DUF1427 family protein [Gallaecimonas mangrovi]
MRPLLGLLLGLLIGAGCRLLGIPLPAPQALIGALLVLAMTLGYGLVGLLNSCRPATQQSNCGGPSGRRQTGGIR